MTEQLTLDTSKELLIGRTGAEAETPILWPPDKKNQLIGKDPDDGKYWEQGEKGETEGEMVECAQTPGDSEGQGSLACRSPRVTELGTT